MPNPVLDEQALFDVLDPNVPQPPQVIRNTLYMFLVDCYDRKVQREFFVGVLSQVLNGYTRIRTIETCMTTMQTMMASEPERDSTSLQEAMEHACKELYNVCKVIHEKMGLVMQCPKEGDSIS